MEIETVVHAARDWLHDWQDLVAAVIGAGALIWTVRWTLSTDRRRREQDAAAFRIALGAEIRQLCASALNSYMRLGSRVYAANAVALGNTNLSASQLAYECRYPEPAVYPRGAAKLGALGPQPAFEAVYFYAQLSLLRESVNGVDAARDPIRHVSVYEVLTVMGALLSAVDAAVKALPAFQGDGWSKEDAALVSRYEAAARQLRRWQEQSAAQKG